MNNPAASSQRNLAGGAGTAGLVAKFFSTANMVTLFGIVLGIVLVIGAALIHLPIQEARLVRVKLAGAA